MTHYNQSIVNDAVDWRLFSTHMQRNATYTHFTVESSHGTTVKGVKIFFFVMVVVVVLFWLCYFACV